MDRVKSQHCGWFVMCVTRCGIDDDNVCCVSGVCVFFDAAAEMCWGEQNIIHPQYGSLKNQGLL